MPASSIEHAIRHIKGDALVYLLVRHYAFPLNLSSRCSSSTLRR
ncbi:hypothetical protein LCGC14_2864130, partial [marine sediment metagenome]